MCCIRPWYALLLASHDDHIPWQFLIGDGQVSLGSQVIKPNARKVRKLKDGVICGFAGATADAMTLFERLEMKLQARAIFRRTPRCCHCHFTHAMSMPLLPPSLSARSHPAVALPLTQPERSTFHSQSAGPLPLSCRQSAPWLAGASRNDARMRGEYTHWASNPIDSVSLDAC